MNQEREIYAKVRLKILEDIKKDLMGPSFGENEIIKDRPNIKYLIGILHPQDSELSSDELISTNDPFSMEDSEQNSEIESEEEEPALTETDDDHEEDKIKQKKYKLQSTLGISFYLNNSSTSIKIKTKWAKYQEISNDNAPSTWKRIPFEIEKIINLNNFKEKQTELIQENIYLKILKRNIKGTNNNIISVFLVNGNSNKPENIMYQVEMKVSSSDNTGIFICENKARSKSDTFTEFLYRNKPIFGRGFGCAVNWSNFDSEKAVSLTSEFIPSVEIPGVSTEIKNDLLTNECFNADFLTKLNQDELVKTLSKLTESYKQWIDKLSIDRNDIEDKSNANKTIQNCKYSLFRIEQGINTLKTDEKAFQAFWFMNKVMKFQKAMKDFSLDQSISIRKHEEKAEFQWRPFQLAFILMNIVGITNPFSNDREIVDLLWFPTGGGKTEAYLGISAFLLAYRRLSADNSLPYRKDGGVTIILRYTLRLLTTQQRDRLLKMICAADLVRELDHLRRFGETRFTIGFWVGGQVTPNKFSDLKASEFITPYQAEKNKNNIKKQIIQCPCCGSKNLKYEFNLDVDNENISIYCSNNKCYFSYDAQKPRKLPVYLVDEEIYKNFPSVIISTVDKFAKLPWDEKTSMLFGNCDRYCERHGYLMPCEEHPKTHRATDHQSETEIRKVKPYYPPELIIQDELHLITGPLGTIYAGYETAIEELCKYDHGGGKVAKPKYIASTATIKNADKQIKKLYARNQSFIFPSPGLKVEDSFFSEEISIDKNPYRLYTGICVPGQSMKTTILRIYAIILQTVENLKHDNELRKYIDPYWTVIGYFNSIRELGGMVRLLDDDVKERLKILQTMYNYPTRRTILKREELTARQPSYKIPQILNDLERDINNYPLDIVLATNMIAVGMDIDRLGLMTVTGQPKTTSEYIQATSRVGRKYPGMIITIYNPYRPRDMSHYENFTGYHTRLYNYVEGTTATPFAARARDRFLHAIAIALLRLKYPNLARNIDAKNFIEISPKVLQEIIDIIKTRVQMVEDKNVEETLSDLNAFLDHWNSLAKEPNKKLEYYFSQQNRWKKNKTDTNRLICQFTEHATVEKPTLTSMRGVESASQLYYYNPTE